MDTSAVDFSAIALATVIAAVVTGVLEYAGPVGSRRFWISAGVLAFGLLGLGLADIFRESPRETHLAAIILGAVLPVLGAIGMLRAARRVRPKIRWLLVFLTALLLLFVGLLLGAAVVPRFLG